MRKLFAVLAAACAALIAVSAAQAGTLTGAALTMTYQGYVAGPVSYSPTGISSGNSAATVEAGSAFAGTFADIPLSTNPALTNAHVVLASNGQINITPAGATVTAPLNGVMTFGHVTHPYFTVPIAAGVDNTAVRTVQVPLLGTIYVTVSGTGWHTGTVTATGLTGPAITTKYGYPTSGAPMPDVTAMGSFNLNANGAGTVTLVSLVRVKTAGLGVSTTAGPTYLTLTYVPEPGTLLLLGAGIAGLVTAGRMKGNASS